ncbi:MAG: nucleoside deaminase [Oscillospiraceae bacterium]|nr:nucleoside deaminase [Oscillospiraceae bacterium]
MIDYMNEALLLAEEASRNGDVPVGCVVVDRDGSIIGRGRNRREELHDATAHAETEAIREACIAKGDWRLDDCSIYVTLEPCPMCAGAIINSRISQVVYAAREQYSGSCGSVLDLFSENYGHHPAVYTGLGETESRRMLQDFFKKQR